MSDRPPGRIAKLTRFRSCRKCLLVWFHRVDVNADPAAADDSDDDVESVTSDIIIPPVVDESSSDDTSSDEAGAPPSKRQAMLNTLVKRPRQKTLQELADETTGSDSSDDKPSTSRPKSRSIHGTVGKHKFTVTGGDQTKIFSALEKAMYQMADSLSNGRGDKNIVEEGEAYRSSILGENTEAPSREQMRVARLARFGAEGGAVSTAVNAAAGPSGARSSPRLATAHQPSPPRRTRRIIIGESSDESPPPRRSPPPPPPANPPPIPTGEHRIKNLVCPHCRDAVDRAPIRIFVLSEIVSLIRAAEATGLVGLAASESHSTSTSAPLPGMVETDLSWGGLFDVIGAETKEQKKARRAVVMDDNEDGVRRCGNCNWEIDETNGICDGWSVFLSFSLRSDPDSFVCLSGREWDLSEGEQSADSFRGDAFPLGTGYNSNEGRSADEEDSESDDGFVVESSPPAPARSRRPIILSDSDNGEPSASEGEVEVITRRTVKKKKPTIVESEEDDDEPVAVKSKPTKNRIVEIESDEEEKKESEGSGEEEGSDEEDDDEGEGVVRRTGSGGGFSSTEEWENDPDNYTRALSNSPEVDSEAAYREECW